MTSSYTQMPQGAKIWLLDLGTLDIDAANVIAGANRFPAGAHPMEHERRDLIMIAALIYHPDIGLLLFDTGSCEDVIKHWGEKALECTPRVRVKSIHGLPEAIRSTGAGDITDIKVVVLSHLHADHAGGLEYFLDTDVEIRCHEEELKNALWSYATSIDRETYTKDYLVIDRLNSKTFSSQTFDIFRGVRLHHCPGHTAGSVVIELDFEEAGTIVLTGDAMHVKENYEQGVHPGTITRDFNAWIRSRSHIQSLVGRKSAVVVLGHDRIYFDNAKASSAFLQ